MDLISGVFIGIIAVAALWLAFRLWPGENRSRQISIHSSIEQIKSVGELSVYRVYTKEIVTETDHPWGEIGKKYLKAIFSVRKMAMIFEFTVDFSYNLRDPRFSIEGKDGSYRLVMPAVSRQIRLADIHFYDEQKSRLIPWLLPELISSIFSDGFSEEDKNRLKNSAREHAEEQAAGIIAKCSADVQESARQTLTALATAFGARRVTFDFSADSVPEKSAGAKNTVVVP